MLEFQIDKGMTFQNSCSIGSIIQSVKGLHHQIYTHICNYLCMNTKNLQCY